MRTHSIVFLTPHSSFLWEYSHFLAPTAQCPCPLGLGLAIIPRMSDIAHPPETLEGWYSLHQIFKVDRAAVREVPPDQLSQEREAVAPTLAELAHPIEGGWTVPVALIGSRSDLMLMHFRPTLDSMRDAQHRLSHLRLMESLRVT